MIAFKGTLIQSVFSAGILIGSLAIVGLTQNRDQVNDPNNPVPDYVKRAAESRPPNPSFSEIRQRAIAGQVWPGETRPPTLSKADQRRIATMLTPDPADVKAHKIFLDQNDTGIFRLYSDFDCESKGIVSVAGKCADQVYGGSTRSLRPGSDYSDIKYNHGKLNGNGFFSLEMLVELGDVSIDGLTLNSPGLAYLNSFVPASDFLAANKQFGEIVKGVKVGDYSYSRAVEPKLDRTYAIRIVAFDNKDSLQKRAHRSYDQRDMTLLRFHALQQDKRSDVIVVFRVIRLGDDGNITVIWKQLSRKKPPVISFGENERLRTFK